jgi:ribonuclease HI
MEATILIVKGSSLGSPSHSGFGGVLCDSDGTWLCGFAGFIGISNNLHAELLAIMHGLTLSWDKGHRNVICYSDSLHAIKLSQAPPNSWHVYATIIRNINDLLNLPWNVHLTHTLREENVRADFLAKHGANHDSS